MPNLGRQAAKDLITALKAATPDRASLRQAIGDASDALHAKMSAMDDQSNTAATNFAATKTAQFATFNAALPDVGDPVP